jgi:site-specific DNA-methyltransferase (adenine-specific)
MTPTWESAEYGVSLYCGDCLEVLPTLAAGSVDMVWTDPPYGHNNNNNGDLIHNREHALGIPKTASSEARPISNDSPENMRRVVDGALSECARVLKRDYCCCCCCGGGGGPTPTFAWVADRMDAKGLSFFHAVVWDKGGLGMGWKYRRNYEFVMVSHRKGGKLKWEWQDNGLKTANVVRIPKIIPSAIEHPTPKPVELIRHFLELHAKPGDVVLDPFMGSGPTAEACIAFGCRFIGIEIDPHWYNVAEQRVKDAIADRRNDMFGPLPAAPGAEQTELFGGTRE